jgi:hypothetical protein
LARIFTNLPRVMDRGCRPENKKPVRLPDRFPLEQSLFLELQALRSPERRTAED